MSDALGRTATARPAGPAAGASTPVVFINNYAERDVAEVDHVFWTAMNERYPNEFFIADGEPVRREGPELVPLTEPVLARAAHGVVRLRFLGRRRAQEFAVTPAFCRVRLGAAHAYCPPLVGVWGAPFVRADGTTVSSPGYDRASQIFADFERFSPHLIAQDSADELVNAVWALPLRSDADRTHLLGLLLLAVLRFSIPGPAPLHMLWGVEDAGSLETLADAIAYVLAGRPVPRVALGGWDHENERVLRGACKRRPSLLVLRANTRGATLGQGELVRLVSTPGLFVFRAPATREQRWGGHRTVLMTSHDFDADAQLRDVAVQIRVAENLSPLHPSLVRLRGGRHRFLGGLLWLADRGRKVDAPRELPGFPAWSKVVGGALAAIGLGDDFLAADHRVRPRACDDLAVMIDDGTWPIDEHGRLRELRAKDIIFLAQQAELSELHRLATRHLGHRASETDVGIFLRTVASRGWVIGDHVLRRRNSRDGAVYLPEKREDRG